MRRMSLPSPMALLAPPWRRVVGTGGCSVDTSAECLLSHRSPGGSVPLANLPPPLAKARPLPRRMVRGAVQTPQASGGPVRRYRWRPVRGEAMPFLASCAIHAEGGCRCRPAPDAAAALCTVAVLPVALPLLPALLSPLLLPASVCLFCPGLLLFPSLVVCCCCACFTQPPPDADGSRWERLGSGRPRESWVWWCRGSVLRLLPPSPSLLFLPHHCGSSGAWNKRARRDGKRDRAECSAGWSGWLAPGL